MKVNIKSFEVQMDLKKKGMELEIRNPDGTHLGDLVVTMSGLTWCQGKKSRRNGIKRTWKQFTDDMQSYRKERKQRKPRVKRPRLIRPPLKRLSAQPAAS
jgi:hypothetical protein